MSSFIGTALLLVTLHVPTGPYSPIASLATAAVTSKISIDLQPQTSGSRFSKVAFSVQASSERTSATSASTNTQTAPAPAPGDAHNDAPKVDGTLGHMGEWGRDVGWILAFIVTSISSWAAFQISRRAFFASRANILVACHNSYDQIQDGFHDLQIKRFTYPPLSTEAIELSAKKLYARFWGLQYAQYRYYMDGVLRRRDFQYWLSCRFRDYHAADTARYNFAGVTFRSTWENWKRDAADDEVFVRIMDLCMDVGHNLGDSRARRIKVVEIAVGFAKWNRAGVLRRLYIEKTGRLSPAVAAEIDKFETDRKAPRSATDP